MPALTIFLDDGGVMSDNAVRGPQWQALVAEYFAPRLGGAPAAWSEANRRLADSLWGPNGAEPLLPRDQGFDVYWRAYLRHWLEFMCRDVGVPFPEDSWYDLAMAASIHVTERVRAFFPEVVQTIRSLAASGYEFHTASNEVSWELDGYLRGMDVRGHFGRLFGPDLVDAQKPDPAYYLRAFEQAGVSPAHSVVLDDSGACVAAAMATGATGVLVDRGGNRPLNYEGYVISSLAELLPLLEKLEHRP